MSSGRVIAADRVRIESPLTAPAAATDTVLVVADAGIFADGPDFAEARQWLVIGEDLTPREYIATEADDDAPQQTITLAAPVGVSLEAGLPVTMWDPDVEFDDKRAAELTVTVALDEQPDAAPVTATVRHELVPQAGVESLQRAQVSLAADEFDQWHVETVHARPSAVDSTYISTPAAAAVLAQSKAWQPGLWATVKWTPDELVRMRYEAATGIFWFTEPGRYRITFGASFAQNPDNARALRARYHLLDEDGAIYTVIPRYVKIPAVDGVTAPEVNYERFFRAGEGVSFEANQTSGGVLMLLGADVDPAAYPELGTRPTEVSITRGASS